MDLTHIAVTILLVGVLGLLAVEFIVITRILRKDEAIDAATFLALRQLEEYVKSSKQPSGKPS